MKVCVVSPEPEAERQWREELAARLPGANVRAWHADPAAAAADPADYAVGWHPPADFFARQPRLKAFFSAGAGVDHLLRHPGLPRGLPVYRLEDAGMGPQMAAYCAHEVARLAYRYGEYEAQQRSRTWRELPLQPIEAFTVGVFGLGVLGAQVARALRALGFPVVGYSRSPKTVEGIECMDARHGLQAFLARCRVLVLVAPLTAETDGLFDARALDWLPQGAWLINIARGRLVDEDALLRALDSGRLAGATLDVFRREPLPEDHPFWTHPRVRITPHVAGVTVIADSARQVAGKILALERGEPASGAVDPARGY